MLERVIPALDAAASVVRRRASGQFRHLAAAGALSNRSECAPLLLDVLYVIIVSQFSNPFDCDTGSPESRCRSMLRRSVRTITGCICCRGERAPTPRACLGWDGRNPLSPWWYIAARKIILEFDAGLLILRYMTAAVLALSLYCMVVTVAGRQSRLFAISLAILTVFWMANRYTDQVIWNFHGALCASLISVAAYAQFIESGRRAYFLYAVSIIAWFLAFATYTLQCGAVLAIGYLALRRTPVGSFGSRWLVVKRIGLALTDTAPYLALFFSFLCFGA